MNRRDLIGMSLAAVGGVFMGRRWYQQGRGLIVPRGFTDLPAEPYTLGPGSPGGCISLRADKGWPHPYAWYPPTSEGLQRALNDAALLDGCTIQLPSGGNYAMPRLPKKRGTGFTVIRGGGPYDGNLMKASWEGW